MYQHNQEEAHQKLHASIFNPRWYAMKKLRELLRSSINSVCTPDASLSVLDFGCGSKPYKPYFDQDNHSYFGADISLNPEKEILITEDGRLETSDAWADLVLSTQVLEHVDDPKLYLYEAHRVLKPGGKLILSTHGTWMFHPDPNDYWRWTSQGLRKIVTESGFEIMDFQGMMGRSSIGLQLFQDGFLFKIPKFIVPVFSLIMQVLIWLADLTTTRKTRNQDAGNFVLIAEKR